MGLLEVGHVVALRRITLPADLHCAHTKPYLLGCDGIAENRRPHARSPREIIKRMPICLLPVAMHKTLRFLQDLVLLGAVEPHLACAIHHAHAAAAELAFQRVTTE